MRFSAFIFLCALFVASSASKSPVGSRAAISRSHSLRSGRNMARLAVRPMAPLKKVTGSQEKQGLRKVRDAWKQAAAGAALGFLMAFGGDLNANHALPAFAEGASIAEQMNMDALKAMTKDAMEKGYDQAWIDDHLAQMEARGYDIEWVQKHLGAVMEDAKEKTEVNPKNMMFKNLDKGKAPEALPESRVVSSIPRTNVEGLPTHQEGLEGIDNWVYPSPKMFWNAMDRKGKHPERYQPEDISGVVRIHNFVNEKAWNEILKWEEMHTDACPAGPTLTSFKGKYDKLSGKGFINSYVPGMLGAPFDRHDWVINRCGKPVRYVLDYYKDPTMKQDPKIRLDVRPAPDSVENLIDWVRFPSANVKKSEVNFEATTAMKTADQVMKDISSAN